MWCLYPFLEVNAHDEELYSFAFQHYYKELTNVLETFGNTLGDHQLPENPNFQNRTKSSKTLATWNFYNFTLRLLPL